jgi:phage-related protein
MKIIDADFNEYTMPKTFHVRAEPVARKQAILDVAFCHGAKDVSDGKMTHRIIEVSGRIWAATDEDYNDKWDDLAKELVKENILIEDRGRRIKVLKAVEIEHVYPSQVDYRYGEVSINFLCLDPFWYAAAAESKQFEITESPKTVKFDCGGNVDVYPVIQITCTNDNTDFTLKSVTDGDKEFRIQDPGALAGQVIEVDCAKGTVKRGTTDIISKFTGLFLRILGGMENEFVYTGANCTLKFMYKEAWL